MSAFDWNDAQHVLAVMRAGSSLTAAKALKVSQPTVARRTAAFEAALNLTLFERTRTGVRLTEQAEALRPHLEALEAAARNLEAAARAESRRVAGVVRVTTNEIIANFGLAPALREFQAQFPEVRVEVIVTDRILDLAAGEADVAIRGGSAPTEPGLVVRRLGRDAVTVFGSAEYLAQHGRPTCVEELNGHTVVTCEGPYGALETTLEQLGAKVTFSFRTSTVGNMIANGRHGLGLVVLPDSFFREDPDLQPCFALPGMDADSWLVTHERLRHAPRVRAFLDFAAAFQAARSRRAVR
jgi:DNA-binding transcriptional LysR family regulator